MSLIFKINSMIEVYKSHCRKPSKREAQILLALTLIGLFGNYLNIDLFFGVNFIFGSFTLNDGSTNLLTAAGTAGSTEVDATWTLNISPFGIDGSTDAGTYTDTVTITVAAA